MQEQEAKILDEKRKALAEMEKNLEVDTLKILADLSKRPGVGKKLRDNLYMINLMLK